MEVETQRDEWTHLEDGWEEGGWAARLRELPSMHDIFTSQVATREFSHRGLRSMYRQEYGRLCARVVQYNCDGAWDHMAEPAGRGETDTVEKKRSRVAWIELSMFPKAVLRAEKRG
eukprot:11321672-Karenia_brevis.AAC.1